MKAQADSSSRGQKDLICREEKRKAAWGHAGGPRNQWSHGSGWKLFFIPSFVFPKGRDVAPVFWEGEVSPWPIIIFWDLLQVSLSMITLTAFRDRDDKAYSVTASCWQWVMKELTASGLTMTGDHNSRSFPSPSVVGWILRERKQTWQVSLNCKDQTQVRK
jgi:hypothetical protein